MCSHVTGWLTGCGANHLQLNNIFAPLPSQLGAASANVFMGLKSVAVSADCFVRFGDRFYYLNDRTLFCFVLLQWNTMATLASTGKQRKISAERKGRLIMRWKTKQANTWIRQQWEATDVIRLASFRERARRYNGPGRVVEFVQVCLYPLG